MEEFDVNVERHAPTNGKALGVNFQIHIVSDFQIDDV